MARRVETAGLSVEQKGDPNYRRVEAAGVMLEWGTPVPRRVEAAGIMVEWQEEADTGGAIVLMHQNAIGITGVGIGI